MAAFHNSQLAEPVICPFCNSVVDRDTIPVDAPDVVDAPTRWDDGSIDRSARVKTGATIGSTADLSGHQPWSQLPHPVLIIVENRTQVPIPAQCVTYLGRRDEAKNIYPHVDFTTASAAQYGVSRRHARIIQTGNGVYIEDLNSTNGTFVNGQRLIARTLYPLEHGDMLHLGQLRLAVVLE